MEELQVSQQLGVISTNLDAIAAELKEQMAEYKDYTVTEDSVTADKKVLADLRKLQKSMEDARKSVKKEWEKPYKEFEAKYKSVLALVDEPIELISGQLQVFEAKRVEEKQKLIGRLYEENIGEFEEYLPLDSIFKPSWVNVSTKEKDIVYDLSELKMRVVSDINVIKGLSSEIEGEILDVYRKSGNNLAAAIERNTQYLHDKNFIETKEPAKKISAEAMGSLNEVVEKFKTVHIIISASDLQAAKNALDFNEIKYQILEDK